MIRPDDEWFPGLQKTREEFESFKWIYGKTPKFKVNLMKIKGPGIPQYRSIIFCSWPQTVYIFQICTFQVTQTFPVPETLFIKGLHTIEYLNHDKISTSEESIVSSDSTAKIQIELEVNSGIVELVKIQQQPYVGFLRPEVDSSLASAIQGERFGPHLPDTVRDRIKDTGIFEDCDEATQDFLADCVHKMIGKFA